MFEHFFGGVIFRYFSSRSACIEQLQRDALGATGSLHTRKSKNFESLGAATSIQHRDSFL